jgi:hypothetical protein
MGWIHRYTNERYSWKHNVIQTNRVSPAVQDNREVKREIARDRNVNASSASARSRAAAANPVAGNKAAVSKPGDKADCPSINGRRKPPSAACYAGVTCRRIRASSQFPRYKLEAIAVFLFGASYEPLMPIGLLTTKLSGRILG